MSLRNVTYIYTYIPKEMGVIVGPKVPISAHLYSVLKHVSIQAFSKLVLIISMLILFVIIRTFNLAISLE